MKSLENKTIDLPKICLLIFSLALLFITITPFLILCLYNHPSDNDNWAILYGLSLQSRFPLFEKIFNFRTRGMFQLKELFDIPIYNNHNGFDYSTWLVFIRNYHLRAFCCIVSFWGCCTIFFRTVNTVFLKFKGVVFLFFYSIFVYLCFNGIHWSEMIFYEHVSTGAYNSGLCYFLLFISSSLKFYNTIKREKLIYGIFAFITLYACVNSLEIYSFIVGSFVFAFIIYDYVNYKRINWFFIIMLAFCLIVFLRDFVSVKSYVLPDEDGNIGKYKALTNQYSLLRKIVMMFTNLTSNSLEYAIEFFFGSKYSIFVIILASGIAYSLYKNGIKLYVRYVFPFYFIIFGVTGIFSFAIPRVFDMHRYSWTLFFLMTIYYLALFVSFILFIMNIVTKDYTNESLKSIRNIKIFIIESIKRNMNTTKKIIIVSIGCALPLLLSTLLPFDSTVARAWKDILKGDAATYNREMNERYKAIFEANGSPVTVNKLTKKPKSLFYHDSFETDEIIYIRQLFRNENIYFDDNN